MFDYNNRVYDAKDTGPRYTFRYARPNSGNADLEPAFRTPYVAYGFAAYIAERDREIIEVYLGGPGKARTHIASFFPRKRC